MSCNVIRNANNTINSVLAKNGQESELFNQVNNNLFLGGAPEASLNVFMAINSLNSESVVKDTNGEPKMFFRNENGNVFEDMEDALISTESGKFEFGVYDNNVGFIPAGNFNTDSSPINSFLAKSVREGVVSTERNYNKETGESFLKGKGEFNSTIKASQETLSENLSEELGLATKITADGVKILENTNPYVQIVKKDGSVEVVTKSQARESLKDKNVKNKADIFIRVEDLLNKTFKEKKKPSVNSNIYKNNLLSFLNGLGFSTVSLDEYQKSYEVRHGDTIGVEGLVDLANKVVAIAEGVNVEEVMTEEVAHLIIEAYSDQASIADALLEVVNTQEYREYAEKYRNKYSDELQGVALEEKVRKEILGKVLAKEMLNNRNQQPSNFILDIWQRFLNFIQSRFTPRKRTVLDSLTSKIIADFNANNTNSFSNKVNSTEVYFSLSTNNEIEDSLKRVSQKFKGIAEASRKTGTQTILATNEIRVLENMTEVDFLNQINKITSVVKTNLKTFDVKSKTNDMSAMDFSMFADLYRIIFPELEKFSAYTSSNNFSDSGIQKIANSVNEDLKSVMQGFSLLNARIKSDNAEEYARTFAEYVTENDNLSEEDKKEVSAQMNNQIRDLSLLGHFFSPLSESSSPYVRMLGRVITDMFTSVDNAFRSFAHNASRMFKEKGWQNKQKNIISKDSYYFNDFYDYQSADNAIMDEVADAINSMVVAGDKKEIRQLLNNSTPNNVLEELLRKENPNITDQELYDKKDKLDKAYRLARYNNKTHRFSIAKLENDEKLREVSNMSDDSFMEHEYYRQQLNEITGKYYKNGKLNLEGMSQADKSARDSILSARRLRVSPISPSGEIMDGLDVKTWDEMTPEQRGFINDMSLKLTGKNFDPNSVKKTKFVVLQSGYNVNNLSLDARYSLDVNNFNLASMIQREANPEQFGRVVSKQLLDGINTLIADIKKYPEMGQIYSNVLENLILSATDLEFTDTFYDYLNTNRVDFTEEAQKIIDNETDANKAEQLQEALDAYKKLALQKSEMIKAYRSNTNSTEISFDSLSAPMRETWINIDEQIADIRRKFEIEDTGFESLTDRVLSEDFEKARIESGKSEYDFALTHMSNRRKLDVQNFRNYLDLSTKANIRPNKRFEQILDEIREETPQDFSTWTDDELVDFFSTQYAKKSVASYFYGSRLKNIDQVKVDILNALKSGEITAEELFNEGIEKVSPYVKYSVKPDYAEYNIPDRFLDPEYNPIKGSVPRAKFHKPEFLSRYGISEQDYNDVADITELNATSNTDEFDLLKFLVQNNKDANKDYNTTTHIMLRPQITKSGYEKIKGVYKLGENVKNIQETIKESLSDRVDEMSYGDTDFSNVGLKVIPKMHRRRVEDAQHLTDNLFQASMLMLRESKMYLKKLETKKRVDALINQAENKEFIKGGISRGSIKVKGEVSQTVKAMRDIADNYLYGIKQDSKMEMNIFGRNVDMTRLISKLQSLSSKINLGYSAMIPLTSLTTGVYNNIENNLVKEYYSKSSINRARVTSPADMAKYISSEGQVYSKSRLGALIEMFGLKPVGERFDNSASTRGERILSESMFLADNIMNVPVLYQSLYATLYDYRYYESADGKKKGFMNRVGFENYLKTTQPGIKKADIENYWKNIEKQSFMDAIDFNEKTGEISIKKEFSQKLSKTKIDRTIKDISAKVRSIGQQVDGVMNETDKVLASRNAILNTMLQHRGFLFINLARAFKGRRYNFATSKIEEGHYTSAIKFLMNIIKDRGKIGKAYMSLESDQKKNVQRVAFRTAITMMILQLAQYLKGSDDEDDTFAEDLARIITYRTYNEVADLSPLGMVKTTMSSIKQPIVLMGTLETGYKAFQDLSDSEKAWSEKSYGNLRKLTMIGKTYDQLSDLDTYTNSWLYHKQTELPEIYNYKPEDE